MNTFAAILFATFLASPSPATPPQPGAKSFDSPKAAADALLQAASADDNAGLLAIFGPSGEKIVTSADPVKDKNDRQKFIELAKEKMDVEVDPKNPHRATLVVGSDEWPFPVALAETNGKWQFATKEGLREVLYRRIGQDEIDAMDVCRGYVEAQVEYATEVHDESGTRHYAERLLSTAGKKDGLAWVGADGKPEGPIADGVAKAIAEGYTNHSEPFHGYYFKVLMAQGPAAPHGALDYVIQGQMIGGFALVAWPAEHRVTGVKTFIINHDGILYEKDLGPDTAKIASEMKAYNPDKTWKRVPDTD
ncbi:MAG TPA: DUF2950 domain-containing protein [Thermoanaerobaculia bacterium]|jgi:hypothetical protein|nr:DUF2950 domain-containing protein [Thermoanaerobaculia bacterium]